jgi:hypothetical protein
MPPRPPPPPGAITVLQSVAALAAVWVTVALDQALRGLLGLAMGIPLTGFTLDASRAFLPVIVQGPGSPPTVGLVTLVALAGAIVAPPLALGVVLLLSSGRVWKWVHGFSLAWLVVAVLWLPTALAAAALPGSSGPVAELYGRLGDPTAGRWTALALALAVLVLVAGPVSGVAVSVGRRWMRADSPEFRRRLVRVTAGWPGLVAAAALLAVAGWARSPWLAPWPLAVLAAFHTRTR